MRSAYLFFAFALLLGSAYAFIVVPTQPQVLSGLAYSSGAAVPLPERSFPTDVLGPTPIRRAPRQTALKMPGRPEHIQEVITMEEYNAVVAAEKDQVVVVRFYAPWCRACKAMAPSYYKFTRDFEEKNIKFVDCPMTAVNADLHASLGVNSIPFVHVYHPEAGLVEERKLSRKYYNGFEKAVKAYFEESCDLSDTDDCSSPWEVQEVDNA